MNVLDNWGVFFLSLPRMRMFINFYKNAFILDLKLISKKKKKYTNYNLLPVPNP